ncbi:MAG: nucleotide exchange factor GrpE [Myxococcota bacterium]
MTDVTDDTSEAETTEPSAEPTEPVEPASDDDETSAEAAAPPAEGASAEATPETTAEATATPGGAETAEAPESEGAAGGDEVPDEAERLRAERDKLKEQLLRTAADFDNFRKRALRELDDARRRTREDALREILPVIDNLERAAAASENATEVKAVAEGVQMVLKGFEEVAGRLGLVRVTAIGEKFDPNVHDAVQQMESADKEPGTILAEVVPGYQLGERLLRPAMVVVAKKPADATEQP